jgi:hypothetical protein
MFAIKESLQRRDFAVADLDQCLARRRWATGEPRERRSRWAAEKAPEGGSACRSDLQAKVRALLDKDPTLSWDQALPVIIG